MINYREILLKVLNYPFISDKNNKLFSKFKILTFKVNYNSNKKLIKDSIYEIFKIKPIKINILIIKGKSKIYKNIFGKRKKWKKAYIFFKKNENFKDINNLIKLN
ncbi:50S ribosomal protein L23 [endosymbiont of Sipalinus gigas]|uniref:50S ribosomal protein L23 n=1 Tax=endosymbiont of Sipalinus gigas TaxID=1972134 RepID=UPI000DC6E31F|nr:50S ribosomal protein L23 [endosymbiont of Sipalinus gigas]BBA85263.1 50S ribosomal protein L23 [endosymbiont of Sipalinus gigas]